MPAKGVIIFSGFNQRAVIAFLRTVDAKRVPYAIIARSGDDPIFRTAYKERVNAVRSSLPLAMKDVLNCIGAVRERTGLKEHVIAPSTEGLNRFMLKHRAELEDCGCQVPLVDERTYELISDKYSFGCLCRQNDILVPGEYTSEDGFQYPLVAKPKRYAVSSPGLQLVPVIIADRRELAGFYRRFNRDDYYFQEFVAGKSVYLLYYFRRDGKVFKYSQRNVAQQPEGRSIVAAVCDAAHLSREAARYERLFLDCGFFGLVMVEVRQKAGKSYMIEANPRFWGPSQLMIDAGHNLFEAFLHDFGLSTSPPNFRNKAEARYFWSGGLAETLKQKKELAYHQGTRDGLMMDLPVWLKWDVYKREDTLNVFMDELS